MNTSQQILSELVTFQKYAKYLPELQRRETWSELCDRNMEMHIKKFPELKDEIVENFEYVRNKQVFPSMRSMQFAGLPIELSNARLYNCSYHPASTIDFFSETLFLLLSGVGVGYSVQRHHVEQLPAIKIPTKYQRFLISDSIAGWSDAVKVLMRAFLDPFKKTRPLFDFRDIRHKGMPLITSGGKAPGPEPLKVCLAKIESLLESKQEGTKLSTLEVHDIACHIADAVLAGGIRRAAMIALFSPDDHEMLSCKTSNWWELNPQRARANNSVVLHRNHVTQEIFAKYWDYLVNSNSGEPGFMFTNNTDLGLNPCCFSATTKIETQFGEVCIAEIIERINANEVIRVKSYNEFTQEFEYKQVVAGQLSRKNAELIKLSVEDAHGVVDILCTPDHKFLTYNGIWIQAQNLNVDTPLLTEGSRLIAITPVDETQDVYDIEVKDNHNFVVSGLVAHNCEISLRPNGFCNLTTINGETVNSQEEFNKLAKSAAFLGTLQASYTDFYYLSHKWEQTAKEEALLGVSITGYASGIAKYDMTQAANCAVEENKRVAKLIGINPAKRVTCTKPEGSVSCVAGTSSGIHAFHSEYYIRRIRINKAEALYTYLSINHPELLEDEFFSPTTTAVISIPQKATDGAITRHTESPIELLERIKYAMTNWVLPGHIEGENTHNISSTVSVKENEWDSVRDWIWENREHLTAISCFPHVDANYKQMPFEDITKEQYEELSKNLHKIDLSRVIEMDANINHVRDSVACSGSGCVLV